VYVDYDPIVHVHPNALLTGTGTTSIVLADLRDSGAILAHPKAGALIDFGQPVALLLVAITHFLADAEDPARIIAVFRDALPEGSYLALSHATGDFRPGAAPPKAPGGDLGAAGALRGSAARDGPDGPAPHTRYPRWSAAVDRRAEGARPYRHNSSTRSSSWMTPRSSRSAVKTTVTAL
jgi:S-adenosyl methyltransferase